MTAFRDDPFWQDYWHGVEFRKRMARFMDAPAFEEAGVLLAAAGNLWQGRYGRGRVHGAALRQTGATLLDAGYSRRESGLGWSAHAFPDTDGDLHHLLHSFREKRHYGSFDERGGVKHPLAARRLVAAAASMVERRLQVMRGGVDALKHDYDLPKEIRRWEDLLEVLGDGPSGQPPEPALPREAVAVLEDRAVFRLGEGLCATARSIVLYAKDFRDWKHDGPPSPWELAGRAFAAEASASYRRFATWPGLDSDETAALLEVEDKTSPYVPFADRHYAPATAVRQAEEAIAVLIASFLYAADLPFPASDETQKGVAHIQKLCQNVARAALPAHK